jgi:hypothetical protein
MVSTTIWEKMSRALSLSSAGTTYQGTSVMVVAVSHSANAVM